jgi:RNA recognition motif-containing protein
MNIYVGNLSYETTEDELRDLFEEFGTIVEVSIIKDRETGRSKGFGFVEMEEDAGAEKAIKELDGNSVNGRNVTVNQARPRNDRSKPRRKGW